ncbi:30S ribosome-binding factor RbfA [Microscilla marina]|uniref:Ribosome-binding factor A n=1 Tax=Microscilla marina ATCC 23134 TaxID=313606 RepID=A1ZSJ7_MICM2|nr:30S ribosome-binding factor RbfA [Microscilla marina]EAY26577.1 ribosome-binding factor A [Microscilla marina ATCC 23134]
MESKRQQKFARLIQKDLADIFQREVKDIFKTHFVTITNVKVTPDLGIAYVYLSILAASDKQAVVDIAEDNNKMIRQVLARKIKNQVRAIPELRFFLDDTSDYVQKMDELFDNLDIPPSSNNEGDEETS